jgi:capsular exopolysaccharide synthesis family protein
MGKVYDALRRAEEQRARAAGRPGELAAGPLGPETAAPATPSTPRDRGGALSGAAVRGRAWRRWLRPRAHLRTEDASSLNKRRIALLQPESFVAEQFRTLRARLDSLAAQQALHSVAVTSAAAGEGKTTAAVNLALVTAMSVGRRVLLVDCDLRKPTVHLALGLRPERGLADVLMGSAKLEEAVVPMEGNLRLDVLAVRTLPQNPSELLASSRMREILAEAAERYDRVVLDVPPTLGLPDAKILSEVCDGVVFVVRADVTPQEEVQAALDVIDRRRVLGVVLNGFEAGPSRYGYRA